MDQEENPIDKKAQANAMAVALLRIIFFIVGFVMLVVSVFCQVPDKVQKAVDAIKATNYCTDQDYHTDGQRTVWVKSYKQWVPNDLKVIQKEAPDILKFLVQAIQHNRYDALEQLLPDYYRAHGGTKAFAGDILRACPPHTPQSNK